MMRKILITINNLSVSAELNDSVSANKIWGALPLSGSANVWGDEVYFEIPASTSDKPKAYSPVNILGSVDGDSKIFKNVKAGDQIVIDKET